VLAEEEQLRKDFFSAVSHDLKTPLTAIKVAADVLASGELDVEPGDRKELAQTVVEEVERLDRMVGSLLDLARLDAHVLVPRLDVVDPRRALEAAAERARRGGMDVFLDTAGA
jgi:K+-sensing histidine kinase KdpD